jgi:hypothetical protein
MAATEFALVFPLALILLIGLTDLGEAIAISRKVTMTARTVTDLVARKDASSPPTYVTDAMNAAAAVIAPYSAYNLTVSVSEIHIDGKGRATVEWTRPKIAELSSGQNPEVTLPSGLAQPNSYLIWGQVRYRFTPIFKVTAPITLSDELFLSPRNAISITP